MEEDNSAELVSTYNRMIELLDQVFQQQRDIQFWTRGEMKNLLTVSQMLHFFGPRTKVKSRMLRSRTKQIKERKKRDEKDFVEEDTKNSPPQFYYQQRLAAKTCKQLISAHYQLFYYRQRETIRNHAGNCELF